jgi:hypothetical protein
VAESAQITELRTKIAEAKAALHDLILGNKPSEVNFGVNRGTKWAATKPADLRAYIAELEAELATLVGTTARGRGPIYPTGGAW